MRPQKRIKYIKIKSSDAYSDMLFKRIIKSPHPEAEIEDIKESFIWTQRPDIYSELVQRVRAYFFTLNK
jgi:hypothetical protein